MAKVFFKLFIWLLVLLSFNKPAQAQSSGTSNNKIAQTSQDDDPELQRKHRDKWNQSLGTFQFQIINSRINPQINVSVIELIEKNRLDEKTNYIDYRENIRIKILSKSEISKEFKKLDLFQYISSN